MKCVVRVGVRASISTGVSSWHEQFGDDMVTWPLDRCTCVRCQHHACTQISTGAIVSLARDDGSFCSRPWCRSCVACGMQQSS
mmetsp:Transcript_29533/g.65399  ORF Transcript_29533/g.65399 Transcript_29533/m.65399 type:complete len:83 (+) Transcript_29533:2406-2654(+)